MKHMVFGLVAGCMTVLFTVILLTLMDRNVRMEELEQSLAEAMETTMLEWCALGQEPPGEADWSAGSMEEQLEQYLRGQISSDSEVTVEILTADEEKGLLSAKAVERFRYPTGQEGQIESTRTILSDRKAEEDMMTQYHTVRFYWSREDMEQGRTSYKQMKICHGDSLIRPCDPVSPDGAGDVFVEWRDSRDYLADFSQRVEEDLCYYAVFEQEEL